MFRDCINLLFIFLLHKTNEITKEIIVIEHLKSKSLP